MPYLFPLKLYHSLQNLIQRATRPPSDQIINASNIRYSALHIFKARRVGLSIGNVDNWRIAVNQSFNSLSQFKDGNFFSTANIIYASRGFGMLGQSN